MRQYDPDPLMRSMADFDVLLKEMDSQRMQKWMEARGYAPDHIEQSVHDTYRKPPYMNIELHRRLMEEGPPAPAAHRLAGKLSGVAVAAGLPPGRESRTFTA